jgi:HD superfamily phosphodiesterase
MPRSCWRRWAHVQGVVRQAQEVAAILPAEEREVLVAAYLHDLGYGPALIQTGFHALDGARHLRVLGRDRLAGVEGHYGVEHIVARSVRQARAEVERCTAFVEGRLHEVAAS